MAILERMGVVVRNGPRPQNRHVVRKPAADAADAIPEPIEGRQTERVDSRELLAKLEQELNAPRAKSPSDVEAMLEVTVVKAISHESAVVKPVAPARLAHTLRRPGVVQAPPPRPQLKTTTPMSSVSAMTDDIDIPISLAEGSGPLEPLSGTMSGPIPSVMHEQTTEPSPTFEAVFDATKLAGPLARHGQRMASLDGKSPPLRPRDVVLGVLLGLSIVGGAWLTLIALL